MNLPAELSPPPPFADLVAQAPLALFLDFDGTLVEIAETPDGIAVPVQLGRRLAALAARLGGRLALVSGRSPSDLERHLGPLTVACAGSHGAARRMADGTALGPLPPGLPEAVTREIAAFAAAEGVDYEPKAHGGALHSRRRPEVEERCALFMGDLAQRHGLLVKRGKRVAEVVGAGADKGAAVRAFAEIAPFAGARPVFVGDDLTDEDGFRAAAALGGFGIAVGARPSENARHVLADPAAVQHWLGL